MGYAASAFAILVLASVLSPSAAAADSTFRLNAATPTATWTLYVPQDSEVTLHVSLVRGAFVGLTLQAPEACDDADLGVGAAIPEVDDERSVDCGLVLAGWHRVELALGQGYAIGRVRADGGVLLE